MILHFLHFPKRLCPIRLSCSLIINVKFNGYLRFFYIKIALHAIKQKCFLCAFDTLNFKLWLKYAFILSDCRIFLLSISLAGISQCFRFFEWRWSPMKKIFLRVLFLFGRGQACSATPKLCRTCQRCFPVI